MTTSTTQGQGQGEAGSWTIRRVLQWTQQRFVQKGLASPRLDAELLLGHCLGRPRVALYTHYDQPLEPAELESYRGLIKRRLAGEPVAYLIGTKEFYSLPLPLKVTEAVLIPRPETELLVEAALALLPPARSSSAPASPALPAPDDQELAPEAAAALLQGPAEPGVDLHYEPDPIAELPEPTADDELAAGAPPATAADPTPRAAGAAGTLASASQGLESQLVIADIGTGSGAVALAIKHSRPAVRMLAIDRCAEALQVAAANAERLGLAIEFFHGDLLAPLPPPLRLDMIVANLPYIPSTEIAQLAPEVRCEPPGALDGGADGLAVVRRLVSAAPLRLRKGGALLLEIGAGQHQVVEDLLRAAGFADVHSQSDLAHIPRVVSGHLR